MKSLLKKISAVLILTASLAFSAFADSYYVCMGSFLIKSNAITFAGDLTVRGLDTLILPYKKGTKTYYRVLADKEHSNIEEARKSREEVNKFLVVKDTNDEIWVCRVTENEKSLMEKVSVIKDEKKSSASKAQSSSSKKNKKSLSPSLKTSDVKISDNTDNFIEENLATDSEEASIFEPEEISEEENGRLVLNPSLVESKKTVSDKKDDGTLSLEVNTDETAETDNSVESIKITEEEISLNKADKSLKENEDPVELNAESEKISEKENTDETAGTDENPEENEDPVELNAESEKISEEVNTDETVATDENIEENENPVELNTEGEKISEEVNTDETARTDENLKENEDTVELNAEGEKISEEVNTDETARTDENLKESEDPVELNDEGEKISEEVNTDETARTDENLKESEDPVELNAESEKVSEEVNTDETVATDKTNENLEENENPVELNAENESPVEMEKTENTEDNFTLTSNEEEGIPLNSVNQYSVKVRTYKDERNAIYDQGRLNELGFDAYIIKTYDPQTLFSFELHSGAFITPEQALTRQKELEGKGIGNTEVANFNDIARSIDLYNEMIAKENVTYDMGNFEIPTAFSPSVQQIIREFPVNKDYEIESIKIYDLKNMQDSSFQDQLPQLYDNILLEGKEVKALSVAEYEDLLFCRPMKITVLSSDEGSFIDVCSSSSSGEAVKFMSKGEEISCRIMEETNRWLIAGTNENHSLFIIMENDNFTASEYKGFIENIQNDSNLLIYPQLRRSLLVLPNERENITRTFMYFTLDRVGPDYAQEKSYADWALAIVGHWQAAGYFMNEEKPMNISFFDLDYDFNARRVHQIFTTEKQTNNISEYNHPYEFNGVEGWYLDTFWQRNELSFSTKSYIVAIDSFDERDSMELTETQLVRFAKDLQIWNLHTGESITSDVLEPGTGQPVLIGN